MPSAKDCRKARTWPLTGTSGGVQSAGVQSAGVQSADEARIGADQSAGGAWQSANEAKIRA